MFYVESVTLGRRSIFARIWQSIQTSCEIAGYSRAAAHLAAMGRYEDAKEVMQKVAELKK
jgi:hypothetical protein